MCNARNSGASSASTRIRAGDVVRVLPWLVASRDRIKQLHSEAVCLLSCTRSNIYPELIHVSDRSVSTMLLCKVQVHDSNHAWYGAPARENIYLLRLVELIPQRVHARIARAVQPDVSLISDIAHHEANVVHSARYQTTRMTGPNRHDEISDGIAPPARIGGHDRAGEAELFPRRCIQCEPRSNGRGRGRDGCHRRWSLSDGSSGDGSRAGQNGYWPKIAQ